MRDVFEEQDKFDRKVNILATIVIILIILFTVSVTILTFILLWRLVDKV